MQVAVLSPCQYGKLGSHQDTIHVTLGCLKMEVNRLAPTQTPEARIFVPILLSYINKIHTEEKLIKAEKVAVVGTGIDHATSFVINSSLLESTID